MAEGLERNLHLPHLPALHLRFRPALPHLAGLHDQTEAACSRRPPDQEVQALGSDEVCLSKTGPILPMVFDDPGSLI